MRILNGVYYLKYNVLPNKTLFY